MVASGLVELGDANEAASRSAGGVEAPFAILLIDQPGEPQRERVVLFIRMAASRVFCLATLQPCRRFAFLCHL